MKTCPNCDFQNPEDIRICLRCAASLNLHCTNCGSELPPNNRFCGQCGTEIESTTYISANVSPQPLTSMAHANLLNSLRAKMPTNLATKIIQKSTELVGQRREVTVVLVEIANYKQASQVLNSEEMYLAIDEIMSLLAEIIYKYEGTIEKFTGSGLMALFGIPLNHENDPERAVRTALEIQNSFPQVQARLREHYHFDFHTRVGINTGTILVGELNIHQHLEYTVAGDTVKHAAELTERCLPGSILVSFSTYQRTRPTINYLRMESELAEGEVAPSQHFRPLEVRLKPGQARGLPDLQVPMVGRSEHLRILRDAIKQVVYLDNSQIILISGEAGIGKTRLVDECRNALQGHSISILQGTCAAYMRITPYRVVADIIRNFLGISELDPDILQREALRHHLARLELDLEESLPYLLQVLGLLQSDPILDLRFRLLEPSMLQRQIHVTLRGLLLSEARWNPLVLVFDDLHWVDQASQQFLEYLCQSIENVPILLVLLARDFEQFDHAREIRAAVQKRAIKPLEIKLHPLLREDSELLVNQLIQDSSYRAEQLKSMIVQRADGNPYYTEELVRVMIDHGALVQYGGNWHVNARTIQLISQVPATLQDIILARYDLLTNEQQSILQVAAVLGNAFGVNLFQQVIGRDDYSLEKRLRELEDHSFLLQTQFGAEDGYIFKHPMIRDAIYGTMLKSNLKRNHSLIAECIEDGEHWLPGERSEVLAYHYAGSMEPKRAIPYLLTASKKAAKNFAHEAVIHLSHQALELMNGDPAYSNLMQDSVRVQLASAMKFTGEFSESASQLLLVIGEHEPALQNQMSFDQEKLLLLVEALRELGDIRAREGNIEMAEELLSQGMELLGSKGRHEFALPWRRLADRLAWIYFRKSSLDEAYNLADLVLLDHESLELDDPITLASLYNTIGGIYWSRSRYQEAIESVERSLEIYRSLNYYWGMAIAQTNLGVLCFSTYKWQKALHYMEQTDQLQSECGYDPERATNLKNMGEVLIAMGELSSARSPLETSREISERLGMELTQVHAELGLGRLSLLEGKSANASIYLSNARRILSTNSDSEDLEVQVALLEALVEDAHGNYTSALDAIRRAQMINAALEEVENELEILRILGIIHTHLKDYEQAEADLLKMLDLAIQRGDRWSQGRALAELGRMYNTWNLDSPRSVREFSRQAGKALDQAIQIFDDLGAYHDLIQAQITRAQIAAQDIGITHATGSLKIQNEVNQVRAQLGIPQGEWYQAVVLTILLASRQEVDEELVFETIHLVLPNLIEIILENGGQVQSQKDC